jgi:hypothetical protein
MRALVGLAVIVITAAQGVCIDVAAADMLDDRPAEPTLLFFSGGDLWLNGGFLHGGMLWSPSGLDHEGFTLKLLVGSGAYRYRSGALGAAEVIGRQVSGSLMPGWRFKWPGLDMTVFAGLDVQDHRLYPDDPSNDLRGSRTGLRTGFDFWYEPSRGVMLASDASVSSIGGSYTARAAYGWRFLDRVYVGPEAAALACDDYQQFRLGAHMTGLKAAQYEVSTSFGYVRDSDHRSGAYGRFSLVTRR